VCKDIEDWLQPKGNAFRALLVERPAVRSWLKGQPEIQEDVDKLEKSVAFGDENSAQEEVNIPCEKAEECIALLSKKAQCLAAFAVKHGLPKDLGRQIQQDFEEIGSVLVKLVPTAKRVTLKLDLMGANGCSRWHQDHYIGRAVITYNSCGTQYVGHDNVNFSHFGHGGTCKDIVPDESRIFSAKVGDILFMKGLVFPGTPNGLIHRSPPFLKHEDGTAVNRLLLNTNQCKSS